MSNKELLIKRFRTLAKGETILILDERLTADNICEDLWSFISFPNFPIPHNWDDLEDVDQALYIIDNSQQARDWIRKVKIVE